MEEIMDFGNTICDICIILMKNASAVTGLSYGFINVLLFIILGPASTVCFMATTFLSYKNKTKYKTGIIILGIIGLLSILPIFILTLCSLFYSE